MEILIRLKNYRCFGETPVEFTLRRGFTALVGKNNTGKSTLLKMLFELRNIFQQMADQGGLLNALKGGSHIGFDVPQIHDRAAMFFNNSDGDIVVSVEPSDARGKKKLQIGRIEFTIQRADPGNYSVRFFFQDGSPIPPNNYPSPGPDETIKVGERLISLRFIRDVMATMANTMYIGPFRNVVNVGSQDAYFDIRIGQAFVKQWRDWKTGQNIKQNETIYRLTADLARIFEYKSLEINPTQDDQTLQVFVDSRSYRLVELGGGVAQFIVVLGNAGIRRASYLLIDEPELSLHPALQLDFLTTLGSYSTDGVVFATHSLGLARSSAQSIFSFEKTISGASFIRLFDALTNPSEFAGALSFSGRPELGFDRILLVEGRTETAAIQQLLRLYGKEHTVLLLPLGGSSLINGHPSTEVQLHELKRITNRLFALIDSERAMRDAPLSPPRQAFLDVCRRVGINAHSLDRRALENYFTQDGLDEAFGAGKHTQLGLYDPTPAWNKNDNWRVTRNMTRQEIESTDLGQFFATL